MNKNHHIKIQNRLVGDNYEPLIIAEIGINHNGNLSIAKKLVDAAYKAGAEVIKHQTHVVEDEMTEEPRKLYPRITNILFITLSKNDHFMRKMNLN